VAAPDAGDRRRRLRPLPAPPDAGGPGGPRRLRAPPAGGAAPHGLRRLVDGGAGAGGGGALRGVRGRAPLAAPGAADPVRRLSGQDDLSIGTPVAARNPSEVEGLIGFFVNMLVFRADAGRDRDFLGLLRQVREVMLGAYAHQDVPFEKLVGEIAPDRDTSRNP